MKVCVLVARLTDGTLVPFASETLAPVLEHARAIRDSGVCNFGDGAVPVTHVMVISSIRPAPVAVYRIAHASKVDAKPAPEVETMEETTEPESDVAAPRPRGRPRKGS